MVDFDSINWRDLSDEELEEVLEELERQGKLKAIRPEPEWPKGWKKPKPDDS